MINRFDYDGLYGTVLNRFISQAANGFPLTVYGSGGQSRAFIHIKDTAKCIVLAITKDDFDPSYVRIFNQVSEVVSVKELAEKVSKLYNVDFECIDNPRKELASNDLEVSNIGLRDLGFDPILLDDSLIEDVRAIADQLKSNFNKKTVLNSPKW